MEQLKIPEKIKNIFHKYKYVLLVIAVGIVLMLWPEQSRSETENSDTKQQMSVEPGTESQLEAILCKINGVGRVEVMLTTARGEEILYQSDNDQSENQIRQDTVIISDADRAQNGLVTQINPPVYLGAIVVCDGADNATVRLKVVEAVSKATGLGADSISVLKMK